MYSKIFFRFTFLSLLIANLFITVSQIISNYYNYGAESVTFASLLRIANGRDYVSDISEIPLFFNPYSPLFLSIFYPVLKVFTAISIEQLAPLGRIVILSLVLSLGILVNYFFRKNLPSYYHRSFWLFSFLWFLILFQGDILSVKPDFLAFGFEFLAFAFFYNFLFDKGNIRPKLFILSAIFSGLAIATKLNTTGVVFGILFYLIFYYRKFYHAVLYSSIAGTILAVSLSLFYLQSGDRFVANIFSSTQGSRGIGYTAIVRFIEIIQAITFPFTLFYILLFIGLWTLAQNHRAKAILFGFCLLFSFTLATVGQLKIGAHFNYHFGFFLLATIPVSIGLQRIFSVSKIDFIAKPLQFGVLSIVFLQLLLSLQFPLAIFANDFRNYPYREVRAYLEKYHRDRYIYTAKNDHFLPLHFGDRVLLGPWAESFLEMNQGWAKSIPEIKANLSNYQFSVAVKAGSGCENWKPSGIFRSETQHLDRLEKQFGKICVFTDSGKVGTGDLDGR